MRAGISLSIYRSCKVYMFWEGHKNWRNLPVDLNFTKYSNIKSTTFCEISWHFCGLLRKPDLYRGSSRKSWYNLANQGTPATFPRSIPYSPQNLCQIPLILKWIQMWCQRNDLLLPLLLKMTKVQIFWLSHKILNKSSIFTDVTY